MYVCEGVVIRLCINFLWVENFFRNNRSHVYNSRQWRIPLTVPYTIQYRLFISAEKSKIK